MKKISVQFKELNWEKSKAENKPIYDIDSEVVVVASTKSENNYIDELTKSGKVPTTKEVKEFFLDKNATRAEVIAMVNKLCDDIEVRDMVVNHIMDALDGACVFWKDLSRKKK